MTRTLLAYDGQPADGLGHRRRLEALAVALDAGGVQCSLVPTGEAIKGDLVVVDSYRFRADDRAWFDANSVAALDDLRRGLDVDIVVDPSPGAVASVHCARRVLAGPEFALVDPTLSTLATRPVAPRVAVVLGATGGADSAGVGSGIADALVPLLPDAEIRLALGPAGAATCGKDVRIVRTVDGLGPALADADLVVTAAGVTLLESLALGRPTVVVVLADNQRQAAGGAVAADAAASATIPGAAAAAAALARDFERRVWMATSARNLVDGHGARRVAGAITDLLDR